MFPNADDKMLIRRKTATPYPSRLLLIGLIACLLLQTADASLGDRLPEFRECIEVRNTTPLRPLKLLEELVAASQEVLTSSSQVCARENCDPDNDPTPIRKLHSRFIPLVTASAPAS